ncbi:hypothetical protein [Clostridium merdae]|uniref:hypothetical protein n=1 Tax=Clostridium merdae TaxID=1958780 RepID=UPI000A26B600|nr:hypothetical protein [Clostridium merdae]
MTYQIKVWKNRLSEFPNRRRFETTGIENTYDVMRAEGNVTEIGNAFDETEMNDLEGRIADGFEVTASAETLATHTSDTTAHITAAERTKWNASVPNTRKINNKALSADITLTAADVSAVPTTDVVTTANANKLLKLDASGVLPASITGSSTNTTSVTSALTVSTSAPSSYIGDGKIWGVY